MEDFSDKKAEIFLQIRKHLQIIDDLTTEDEISNRNEHIIKLHEWSEEYNMLCKNLQSKLMSQELTLFTQIEV